MPFGFSYRDFAPASANALKREETAKEAFTTAKKDFEELTLPFLEADVRPFTIPLLTPKVHLTSVTYGTFHRWVKENHEGWRCQRREATKEECHELGAYNRGKSYFIDAIYQVPDPAKKKRAQKAAEQRAAKKQKVEETLRRRKNPATIFPKLPQDLQAAVLHFVDTEVLVQGMNETTSPFQAVLRREELWEDRLLSLLKTQFDSAFAGAHPHADAVVPLSERPNWKHSTEFRAWFNEHAQKVDEEEEEEAPVWRMHMHLRESIRADTVEEANRFLTNNHPNSTAAASPPPPPPRKLQWLLQDVPLWEYYLGAREFVKAGKAVAYEEHLEMCRQTNRCVNCFEKWHSCSCKYGFVQW